MGDLSDRTRPLHNFAAQGDRDDMVEPLGQRRGGFPAPGHRVKDQVRSGMGASGHIATEDVHRTAEQTHPHLADRNR